MLVKIHNLICLSWTKTSLWSGPKSIFSLVWHLTFSWQWRFMWWSSGLWHCVFMW